MKLTIRQHDALGHMIDNCREAIELSAETTREGLAANWRVRYPLLHCILIIGEAATRLGDEVESTYPQVDWRRIIGMRNRLVHGYDDVNDDLL